MRFNNLFGETLVLPEAVIPKEGARIMGFDAPENKMSKSVARFAGGHAVNLLDSPKTVKKTIMSAVTDSGRETRFEHAAPGVLNLLTLYHVLTGESKADIEAKFEGQGYGTLKKEIVVAVNDTLEPLQKRYAEIMDDRAELERTLKRGAEAAREIASRTLSKMKAAMGVG